MGKEQRSIVNFFKTAGLSKNYYISVFAGGVAFVGILMTYASTQLSQVSAMSEYITDPHIAAAFQERLLTVALLFFVSFMFFVVSTVFYMIMMGQRVGGAIIAIVAYIGELKSGNYDAKRELRKNDELGAIMLALRELADSLKNKKR
jgi:HAMP domain-containing protein